MPETIVLETLVTEDNFDESAYLETNPDVARAIAGGQYRSGRDHFMTIGRLQNRRQRTGAVLETAQALKLRRIEPLLRTDLPHIRRRGKFDFLTDSLRAEFNIIDTDAISSHDYLPDPLRVIAAHADGLVLDFGSGKRGTYYSNVVNYDVVDYDTTDVIGVGESLPFRDNSFDAVISTAVLEHVKDPWRCAAEIARVLKPGGELWAAVAFMSPVHGYPHHYFNMTAQGLRAIFEPHLSIEAQDAPSIMGALPSLRWILLTWARAMPPDLEAKFRNLRIADVLGPLREVERADWVTALPKATEMALATCTTISARKRTAE